MDKLNRNTRNVMKPKTGIKVLRNGSSFHGGYFKWSLPTQDKDGKWTPGEWTPPVKPVVCSSGYHLTTMPTEWWDSDNECVAYLVEYKGRVDGLPVLKDSKGKFAVEKCRLLRPLTPGELARHRIYTKGTHSIIVSRGKTAIVSGDAVLYCHGSGRVLAYDRSQIFAHENVSVVYRRGDKVKTYSRGSGLDGWSFVDGKWVKARKK